MNNKMRRVRRSRAASHVWEATRCTVSREAVEKDDANMAKQDDKVGAKRHDSGRNGNKRRSNSATIGRFRKGETISASKFRGDK